jgi:hypothetical protein
MRASSCPNPGLEPFVRIAGALALVLATASAAGAQTVIKPVGPGTVVQQPRRPVATAKPTGPASPSERVIVSVNASYLTASRTFDDSRTFDLHADTARFGADYAVEPSVGVDAGAFVRVWKGLAAGVAFTAHSDTRDIAVDASLPHPFLFSSPRAIEGTVSGDHEETGVHLQVAYILPLRGRLQAVVFGGPSFFTVKQSVVTAIQFSESYPYDTASFDGATVEVEEEQTTGFNVGADVAYYFSKNVGVGGIVRFTGATLNYSLGDVDAGGAMVGGGLRLRF